MTMHRAANSDIRRLWIILSLGVALALFYAGGSAWAQGKADKSFHALTVDAKGVEMEIKHVVFYWEEKLSDTSFVPHELTDVPVRRGTATVKIKFENIKHIDVAPSANGAPPVLTITLTDGKRGEFPLALPGSFKGQSEFGEIELPAAEMKRLIFK
jgi:hypothetical protein